jgi:hypothetical protein
VKKTPPPPGTIAVWFVHTGNWMTRKDLHVERSCEAAIAWQQANYQRGLKVSAAHIMRIRGRWYKVQVNTVGCHVPPKWNPTPEWMRRALDLEVVEPPRTYVITHVPAPKPFTWKQRLRILFRGLP